MTIKEIIKALQEKGHNVEAYKRKDGGYLIRSIDDKTFIAAKGNAAARKMMNTTLAESIKGNVGLQATLKSNIQYKKFSDKRYKFTKDLEKEFRKTQRIWREKRKEGANIKGGRITKARAREVLKSEGRKGLLKYLKQLQGYARGYAYDGVIIALADYVEITAEKCKGRAKAVCLRFASKIRHSLGKILEKNIYPTYYKLYDLKESMSAEEQISILEDAKTILDIE